MKRVKDKSTAMLYFVHEMTEHHKDISFSSGKYKI